MIMRIYRSMLIYSHQARYIKPCVDRYLHIFYIIINLKLILFKSIKVNYLVLCIGVGFAFVMSLCRACQCLHLVITFFFLNIVRFITEFIARSRDNNRWIISLVKCDIGINLVFFQFPLLVNLFNNFLWSLDLLLFQNDS